METVRQRKLTRRAKPSEVISNIRITPDGKVRKDDMVKMHEIVSGLVGRANLALRMGKQYGGKRDVYDALGYPEDHLLDVGWFTAKYKRQDIASAVIDRPANKTWEGTIGLTEPDSRPDESTLGKAWSKLLEDPKLKVKKNLVRLDKVSGLGEFGLLLFGFNDVKEREQWAEPVVGNKKLLYLKTISQESAHVDTWVTDSSNERYGQPETYKLMIGKPGRNQDMTEIRVHWSRLMHLAGESLTSDVYGEPRLKKIANRLVDLEKILGGDAEMFWRGARPGYTALSRENYTMGDPEVEELHKEIDAYEHDLRRFITAQGVDINALQQQIADPLAHIDAQLQAISAQTGIPKRILVGSERGELSSTQDKVQWNTLIDSRMSEFAEPDILRPFIDKMMEHGLLPKVAEYNVIWEDLFAPSEKEKVEVGKERATALKTYADSPYAADFLPPKLAYKYLLGLTEDQIEEIEKDVNLDMIQEEREGKLLEQQLAREQMQQQLAQGGDTEEEEEEDEAVVNQQILDSVREILTPKFTRRTNGKAS